MRGLCTCSAVYSVVKDQRKKKLLLDSHDKNRRFVLSVMQFFEKYILPCRFTEAADSASSLQAQ
jgi:hypothetical protein